MNWVIGAWTREILPLALHVTASHVGPHGKVCLQLYLVCRQSIQIPTKFEQFNQTQFSQS